MVGQPWITLQSHTKSNSHGHYRRPIVGQLAAVGRRGALVPNWVPSAEPVPKCVDNQATRTAFVVVNALANRSTASNRSPLLANVDCDSALGEREFHHPASEPVVLRERDRAADEVSLDGCPSGDAEEIAHALFRARERVALRGVATDEQVVVGAGAAT